MTDQSLIVAEIVATVSILTFLGWLLKWALDARNTDMKEIRDLSAADMKEVKQLRAEDMEEIRSDHRDITGLMTVLAQTVSTQDSRVGSLETWKVDHQEEDDRAHEAFVEVGKDVKKLANDVSVLVERSGRKVRAKTKQ